MNREGRAERKVKKQILDLEEELVVLNQMAKDYFQEIKKLCHMTLQPGNAKVNIYTPIPSSL